MELQYKEFFAATWTRFIGCVEFGRPRMPNDGMQRELLLCALALVVLSLLCGNPARAAEVWEVSTRHLTCNYMAADACSPNFEIHRSLACNQWLRSSMDELRQPNWELDGQPPLTIYYAHGNWMTRENARERAWFIANQISRRSCQPFRLIMISWPSQRERKPVRDILENADCADVQALYLACLVRATQGPGKTSFLGFSLGGRVVTGALHLNEGGCLMGRQLMCSEPRDPTATYRLSLAAPAVDRTWIAPNGKEGLALTNVDRIVNLYNSRDPVLRRFRFIDALARPIAAGFAGLTGVEGGDPRATQPLVAQDRLKQYDCSNALGTTHDERSYYLKCSHFSKAIDNLLWITP